MMVEREGRELVHDTYICTCNHALSRFVLFPPSSPPSLNRVV